MVQTQYQELFSVMIEIVEAICNQLFEKVSTIPYAIKQFCKALYQAAKDKFAPSEGQMSIFNKTVNKLIASFLLEKWILNSIFHNLNTEGLIKEFYLSNYCKKNLQLLSQIVYSILTGSDWEVKTPLREK